MYRRLPRLLVQKLRTRIGLQTGVVLFLFSWDFLLQDYLRLWVYFLLFMFYISYWYAC